MSKDNWKQANERMIKNKDSYAYHLAKKADNLQFSEDFLEFMADIDGHITTLKKSQNDIVFGDLRDQYTHEQRAQRKKEIETIISKYGQCRQLAYNRAKSLGVSMVVFC